MTTFDKREEGFEKTVDQVAAIEKQLRIHALALACTHR